MEKKHGKYVDNYDTLSDEEKNKIKRKSMEKKAEIILKEIKKRDDINSGKQKTQSDAWETIKPTHVTVTEDKIENKTESLLDKVTREKMMKSRKADVAYW